MKKKKIGCLLLAILMTAAMLATGVVAVYNYDPNETGSITIHKFEQTDPGEGMEWPVGDKGDGTEIKPENYPEAWGKPLSGVAYTIWKVTDAEANDPQMSTEGLTAIGPQATNEDGIALFENLEPGRYLVKETEPDEHNSREVAPFFVDIPMTNPEGNGFLYNVHVYPKNALVRGDVKLNKVAEGGGALEGAVFGLYTESGNLVEETTTGTDGIVFFDQIVLGRYYLQEISAPEGYTLSTTKYAFAITRDQQSYTFTEQAVNYAKLNPQSFDKEHTGHEGARNLNWELTAPIPGDIQLYQTYTISDTLPTELGAADQIKTLTVKAGSQTLNPESDYSVTNDGQTFTVDIRNKNALRAAEALTITFTTEMTEGASVGAVVNSAILTYQSATDESTHTVNASDTANIYGIQVDKVNLTGKKLPGAEFALYFGETEPTAESTPVYTGTTDENGVLTFQGLNPGTYWIVETKAPNGYASMTKPLQVTIEEKAAAYTEYVTILNTANVSLPITGGVGTLIFTFSGIALMGAAALLYIRSRRKSSAEA